MLVVGVGAQVGSCSAVMPERHGRGCCARELGRRFEVVHGDRLAAYGSLPLA